MSWQIPTQVEQDIIAGKAVYRTFQTGNGGQSILPVPANSYAVIFGYDFSPAGGGFKQVSYRNSVNSNLQNLTTMRWLLKRSKFHFILVRIFTRLFTT
jgi:hypothetical protein